MCSAIYLLRRWWNGLLQSARGLILPLNSCVLLWFGILAHGHNGSKEVVFRHLDAANDCILKLITLTQHKQSQASSAAAPGQRLTDNYCHLSNRSLGSSLAWLSVFQPHRDLNFFPLYWLAYLALTSSFFHHLCLSLVSSFSFSVTFSTLSRQLSLATLLVVSCFPHLSPSRGFIISLLSHPI